MEKIKYGTYEFQLIPNGVDTFTEDKLTLRHETGGLGVDDIENIIKDINNTKRIEVLDSDGNLLQPLEGYTIYNSISKVWDNPISGSQTMSEAEGGIEQTMTTDIVIITLSRPGLRRVVEQLQEEITNTQLALVELYEEMKV